MQLKLFVVPVKNTAAAEAEMNAFLRSHRILAVKKELVDNGENSFWTFCVEYLESAPGVTGGAGLSGRPKVDYKEVLKPEEFEVFSRLREWRKDVADKEGVPVGNYHYFRVHDPKERLICAAAFRERVLHHALMNVCEPMLERAAVFDSYACRKGKGRLLAVARAQGYARTHRWFLKMDIRKYFDSIHHETLRELLERKFKDPALLGLFDRIISSYHTTPGRGLPIGNLTSQHFANFYLGPLDRFLKETVRRGAYVRYMDDFVVWGESGCDLRVVCEQARAFLAEELKLELKDNTAINRTAFGMDFLGYRLFPGTVRLARRSKLRFARKYQRYEAAHWRGEWSDLVLQQRMQALLAFVMPAESGAFRRHVLQRFGVAARRLEPCESGRQLEQQRDQLPDGEPQQQQPDQQEQQHWVPFRATPSSTPLPDGGGADPAAILSAARAVPWQRSKLMPPGVSRLAEPVEDSGRNHLSETSN